MLPGQRGAQFTQAGGRALVGGVCSRGISGRLHCGAEIARGFSLGGGIQCSDYRGQCGKPILQRNQPDVGGRHFGQLAKARLRGQHVTVLDRCHQRVVERLNALGQAGFKLEQLIQGQLVLGGGHSKVALPVGGIARSRMTQSLSISGFSPFSCAAFRQRFLQRQQ